MEIVKSYPAKLDKVELYKLTKAQGLSVKDLADGAKLGVQTWAHYIDEVKGRDEEAKTRDVISIIGVDSTGEVVKVTTISPTFIKSFLDVVEVMDEDPFTLRIIKSTSAKGREFVSCELDF